MSSIQVNKYDIYTWLLQKVEAYNRAEYDIDYDTLFNELRKCFRDGLIGSTGYAHLAYLLQRRAG